MTGINFANPAFLWLLVLIPAMIAYYIIRQQRTTASLKMPDLKVFNKTGTTFRNWLRHILFAMQAAAMTTEVFHLGDQLF